MTCFQDKGGLQSLLFVLNRKHVLLSHLFFFTNWSNHHAIQLRYI